MTVLVLDASAVVAALTDSGPVGAWVTEIASNATLAAPSLLPYEVASVVRRLELARRLSSEAAALVHADLVDLPVELWPWSALAVHSWSHRANLTAYDAPYVALAAHLDAPLVTLDVRLGRAARRLCRVTMPKPA